MRNLPLVSIVVPVYNAEKYVEQTVNSILNQSYRNIECIIIDDGSTDSSLLIIEKFAKSVKIIQQENKGQAAALNTGFLQCRGEYIGYLSADDIIDKDCISLLVSEIDSMSKYNTLPLVIFPRYRTIDGNGKILNQNISRFISVCQMIKHFRCLVGPGALFERSLFINYGGWNTFYKQIPDFAFWIKLMNHSIFIQVDNVLASFRVHESSQTFAQSSVEKADESIRLANEISKTDGHAIGSKYLKDFTSSAYLFSSCLHFRSRRYRLGIDRWIAAIAIKPSRALSFNSIRRLSVSLYASLIYFT